jgi:isoleucyl-tRNA synthetase
MSKHLGNILEPIPLMDEHGADAVRWFMAAAGRPGRRAASGTPPSRRPCARSC